MARRGRASTAGRKIVYITPYGNLAVEIKRMCEKKGEMAEIGSETGRNGATLFRAYVFGKGYWGIV